LKSAQITWVTYYFKFAPATACIWHTFYMENLHFMVGFQSQQHMWHLYIKQQVR
jgi:hypothetical protein